MNEPLTMAAVFNSSTYFNQRRVNLRHKSNPNFKGEVAASENNKQQKQDPLLKYPLRLCAYTNEAGAAVSPIPGIGPKIFALSWVPALLYFGADIYDKYSKGEKGYYSEPSKKNALKQSVFQGLASVLLPTAAVIAGQRVVARASASLSKEKMDVRAKETILEELKRDINQDRLRHFRQDIEEIIGKDTKATNEELFNNKTIKKIKNELTQNIYKEIKIETDTLKRRNESSNIFKKVANAILGSNEEFKYLARIPSEHFEARVKPFLTHQVDSLVNTRISLQRAINADGTFNLYAKSLDKQLYKKAEKLLAKNRKNRNITDKSSFVVKECILGKIQSKAMKLSTVKIAGGFAALALLAQPIDHFVEHKIIAKFFESKQRKLDEKA